MRVDGVMEKRLSEARAKHGQDKKVPFVIRDDGMLYPNTRLIRTNPRFRPYHGDPKASLADRMRFLQGLSARREVVYNAEPQAPFDLNTATLDEVLSFALEQFGAVLDPNKPLKTLKTEVFRLSQLPEGGATHVMPPAVTGAGVRGPDPDDEDEGEGDAPETMARRQAVVEPESPASIAHAVATSGKTAGLGLGGPDPGAGRAMESTPPMLGGRQPRNKPGPKPKARAAAAA